MPGTVLGPGRDSVNRVLLSRSAVSDSVTPWTAARQASLSINSSWSSPKPISMSW